MICSGAFAIAGGLTGSVVGADTAHAVATGVENVGDLLRNPGALMESSVQMFGTDEQRRQYYEDREMLQEMGF